MSIQFFTSLLAFAALVFFIAAFALRWGQVQRIPFPADRSRQKDSAMHGVLYAFTIGMAPWTKESARRHMVAYMRGVGFHIGVFVGLAGLVISPFLASLPSIIATLIAVVTGFGTLMGIGGGILRLAEHNLRSISTPDDHAAVWLVTLFLAMMTWAFVVPSYMPVMYVVAAVMLVYAPLGKIKHCIFFYFGRLLFGYHIGRRGIVRGLEASHGN